MDKLKNPKVSKFLIGQANKAVTKATGVNVMYKYDHAMHNAEKVGLKPHERINKAMGHGARGNLRQTFSSKLVTSVDEFLALREAQGKTPLGGAICLVHALLVWANPATHHLGEQLLVLAVTEDMLVQGSTYKGYSLNPDLANHLKYAIEGDGAHSVKLALSSLMWETDPQTAYAFDTNNMILAEDIIAEEGQHKSTGVFNVYLHSFGCDSSRGVHMAANKNGVWKAREFTSLLSSVHAPPVTTSAADEL